MSTSPPIDLPLPGRDPAPPAAAAAAAAATAAVARKRLLGGVAALIGAALAMSLSPTFVRLADVGPFASAFWRVALALPVLWMWMRRAERGAAGPIPSFSRPTILAGLAFAGDLFFWHLSVMRTTVANATFFATAAPIWVVVFGWLLFRERVARAVLVGLGLCVFGGAALVAQSFGFDARRVAGDAMGIATGVFFGLYFLAVRAARTVPAGVRDAVPTGAARVTFEMSVVAVLVLLAVAVVAEPRLLPRSGAGWAVLAALALVSHTGGQGLLTVALGRLPVAFSSLVIFLEAIAAAGFAWAVLGEAVTPVQALGGLVIIAGIWIARPR